MNVKNMLKSIDFKGLALQHCEKAVIVVVTALLVVFLVSGVKNSLATNTVTPQKIDQLADNLNKSIQNSEWNQSVADKENVKNPDFKAEIAKLMSGIQPDDFLLGQLFYHFMDFGGILRQKPEILKPYHPLALADKGALSLYKVNSKGEFIEREVTVKAAPKRKADDEDLEKSRKDKNKKAAPKAPPMAKGGRSMGGMPLSGGGMDAMMGEYGRNSGMPMGMMGMMGGRDPGGRDLGGSGAISGGEGDEGGGMAMGGNLGDSRDRRTAGNRRTGARKSGDDSMFDDLEERKDTAATGTGAADKADPKVPHKRKIKEEETHGVRWVLITALFPHRDQLKKFVDALHTPDDPPNYEMVKVERREVLSDGSLSEWAGLDMKKLVDIQKRIHDPWVPEDPVVHAAKADFAGLMMKLPELDAGNWVRYVRREAHNAAQDVAGGAGFASGGRGSRDSEGDGMESRDMPDGRELFGPAGGSGAPMVGPGMGGASSSMMSSNSANTSGRVGMGASSSMMQGRGGMTGMGGMAGGPNARSGYAPPAGPQQQGRAQPGQPQAPPKPPVQKSNAEVVQIRFVDYTVEPEHTYQYRLRVIVTNPNFNRLDVINAEVAADKTLTSEEWGEPTPLVYVPADLEYYVLDRVKIREEATLQVHSWLEDMGDWQFSDFKVRPGDPIGAKARDYPLVGWDDPPKIKKTELDFSTPDLLLDVTGGDKSFLFDVDGSELKITERLPTEIFVIDRLGDLLVRNDDFDKNNADRVDREKYIKEIRAKASEDKDSKKAGAKAESGSASDFEGRSAPSRKGDGQER